MNCSKNLIWPQTSKNAINKPVMLQKPMPQSIYIVYTFKDQIIVKSLLLQQTKHEQLEFSSRHLR